MPVKCHRIARDSGREGDIVEEAGCRKLRVVVDDNEEEEKSTLTLPPVALVVVRELVGKTAAAVDVDRHVENLDGHI